MLLDCNHEEGFQKLLVNQTDKYDFVKLRYDGQIIIKKIYIGDCVDL